MTDLATLDLTSPVTLDRPGVALGPLTDEGRRIVKRILDDADEAGLPVAAFNSSI